MSTILWNEKHELGIAQLDEEHKSLINQLNIVTNTPFDMAGQELRKLINAIGEHFESEQTFMEMINYPESEKHTAEHKRLVAAIDSLYESFLMEETSPKETYSIIYETVVSHLNQYDMKIKTFMQAGE